MAATVKTPIAGPPQSSWVTFPLSIFLALVSALLLDCCFPIAGPMPPWRGFIAWIALIPLFLALLNERAAAHPHYLRRAAITGYLCGLLWYILNCYWIYQTMLFYGNVPPLGSAGIVVLFSAVLGLYFALFGFLLAFFRRRLGLARALALAPVVWVAIDLLAARITSVPWDQLGYSQVDNFRLTALAPWTGVYGVTFFLVLSNAFFVSLLLRPRGGRQAKQWNRILRFGFIGLIALLCLINLTTPPPAPVDATAVLLQDNLNVNENNSWIGEAYDPATKTSVSLWDRNMGRFMGASTQSCTPFYAGMPEAGALHIAEPQCPPTAISLIAWPEAPSGFRSWDPRFFFAMAGLAQTTHAAVIAGNIAREPVTLHHHMEIGEFNAASVFAADGHLQGVYDKIHLVPFGEYVPYRNILFFAHHLTQQIGDFNRGQYRFVYHTGDGHTFGVFICYESIFGDEVRHFAKNGAEVLVNISDDGWYGDTSAPWQHLNMARMRAVENRRWLLRDTNTGVTAAIDPYGRVTQSTDRHVFTSLAVHYGYNAHRTFYTIFGDVFAYLCCLTVLGVIAKIYEPRWKEYRARRAAPAPPTV